MLEMMAFLNKTSTDLSVDLSKREKFFLWLPHTVQIMINLLLLMSTSVMKAQKILPNRIVFIGSKLKVSQCGFLG